MISNRYTENPVPERSGSTSEELRGDPLHEFTETENKNKNRESEEAQRAHRMNCLTGYGNSERIQRGSETNVMQFPSPSQFGRIPFAELRWTTFTDSSFGTGERQRHQQGWLVCATNKYFNQERSAPVSVLHCRSRKLTRKAGSPQLVERWR